MFKRRTATTLVLSIMMVAMAIFSVNAGTKNTFSLYSLYGLGSLQTQGTLSMRSMGGAGVAMRTASTINLLNPASYSVALPKSAMFDFGMEGATYGTTQNVNGVEETGRFSTFNFHDIAVQLPVAKKLGMALSVTPYSSVGYQYESNNWLYAEDGNTDSQPLGKVLTTTEGSGEVTEVKLGMGWEPFKNFSIGVAAQYYWGSVERIIDQNIYAILDPSTISSPYVYDEYTISQIKGQIGAQWNIINKSRKSLIIGATYDFGGDLKPQHIRTVSGSMSTSDVSQVDTTNIYLVKPNQLTVGVSYQGQKVIAVADYSRQNWDTNNEHTEYSIKGIVVEYNNINIFRAGLEYTPNRRDVRHYHRRISYRTGFRHSGHYLTYSGETLNEYYITAGAGFPINTIGISKIDLGFEWGSIGSTGIISGTDIGLVRERVFRFSIGVTMFGSDYWFQRPKID